MLLWIQRDDSAAGPERHLLSAPEGLRPDQHPLEALLTREVVLGERRALVRQLGLISKKCDSASELLLPECDRSLCAAVSGANDQYVIMHVANSLRGTVAALECSVTEPGRGVWQSIIWSG